MTALTEMIDCLSSEGTWHWMRVMQLWMAREGGLVLYWGKILHPQEQSAQASTLSNLTHNYPAARHPRWWKTTELIACNFWLTRMGCYVVDYVERLWPLGKCTKTFPASPTGKLMPNWIPDHCWQVISVDLIMELPLRPRLGHYYSGSWSSIQMSSHHTDHIWHHGHWIAVILESCMETPWSYQKKWSVIGEHNPYQLHRSLSQH